jgi:hypothetical protein
MAVVQSVSAINGMGTEGDRAFLDLELDGKETRLTMTDDQVRSLLPMVYAGIAGISASKPGPLETALFPVERWEFGRTPDGSLAVTFQLRNGAALVFHVEARHIPYMRETLEVMEGKPSSGAERQERPN